LLLAKTKEWEWEIDARYYWFRWELGAITRYRDLLFRLVRRDLIANYQQTVLGPFWVLVQPVLTMLMYWLIFNRIVKVSTDGNPPLLFYLSGIICWNFFSDCLSGTMYTFITNAAIFGKVWFPRLLVPLSVFLAHCLRLAIQLILFVLLYGFFYVRGSVQAPGAGWLFLPVILVLTGLFGLGAGLFLSVLTAKYRDLDYTLQFILRLWMFASPVFYPARLIKGSYASWFWLNPLTPLIETVRAVCFGQKVIHPGYLYGSIVVVLILLAGGIALFKRHEQRVTDII
jgi:lipopolysaccharide transport system permease protein